MVYAKVEVGIGDKKKTFEWGKDLLDVKVMLTEGQNQSSCSFAIFDPERKVTNEFLTYIYKIEGLEPLSPPQNTEQNATATNPALELTGEVPPAGSYGGVNLNQTQVNNAYKVAQAVLSNGGNSWDVQTALITVMQESSLVLQTGGDRDSAGWYQQRTTWGDYRTRTDIAGSTGLFLKGGNAAGQPGLFDLNARKQNPTNYDRAVAAQAVQRSAHPDRYAGWIPMAEALTEAFNTDTASNPTQEEQNQNPPATTPATQAREQTLAGSQITIYLGMEDKAEVAYSFIHTGVSYSLYDQSILEFEGKAASFVLHQVKQNNAYVNLTFKELVEKITSNYGLQVRLTEGFVGPKYVYIQQQAETDWELLVRECDRLGLVIKNIGTNQIEIIDRTKELGQIETPTWRLELNKNVTNFSVKHSAESTQGARSSEPGERTSTGTKKHNLNPDTGELIEVEANQNTEQATLNGQVQNQSTIGSNLDSIRPLTDGSTEIEDTARRDNNQRVKGIVLDFESPTTSDLIALTPDDVLLTSGLSDFLDRFWVIESISHNFSATGGFVTSGVAYTPLRNKNPQPAAGVETGDAAGQTTGESSNQSIPGGFIWPTVSRTVTSPFGPRWGRNHNGIDIAGARGTPVFAVADGTVIVATSGCVVGNQACGGGFGNWIRISHSGGFSSTYAHLTELFVSNGQQVKQGQQIGTIGNTGRSFGDHLHQQIEVSGVPKNPLQYLVK